MGMGSISSRPPTNRDHLLPRTKLALRRNRAWRCACHTLWHHHSHESQECAEVVGSHRSSRNTRWLGYSFYDFGGITTLTQLLEIGGSAGFLVGTYLLSKDRQSGYGWFMLMNVTTGWLLYIENYPWFVPQQVLSVIFIIDAYRVRRSRSAPKVEVEYREPRPT